MAKKKYDDDDGRTIFDMSAVEKPNLFSFNPPYMDEERPRKKGDDEPQTANDRPWESSNDEMPHEMRRAYVWGALKASLLIASAFVAGIGVVVYLITLIPY